MKTPKIFEEREEVKSLVAIENRLREVQKISGRYNKVIVEPEMSDLLKIKIKVKNDFSLANYILIAIGVCFLLITVYYILKYRFRMFRIISRMGGHRLVED